MIQLIKTREELELRLLKRQELIHADASVVHDIVNKIQREGDQGLRKLTQMYDGVAIDEIRIPTDRLKVAEESMDSELRSIIVNAAENIRRFHRRQIPQSYSFTQPDGTWVAYRWRPIQRVGIYIPGGRFPLLSTVLMNSIPAEVAGVKEIAICTPPGKSGYPDDAVLGTCSLLGISEVYRVGGAQAIAALAFGTESITAVDKITGPGNAFVVAAKQAVSTHIAIDMIAGPTELVIITDESADPDRVAVELISQAEHDPQAWPIVLTNSETLASEVIHRLNNLLNDLATRSVAEDSLTHEGFIFVGDSIKTCVSIANRIAPEHLSLQIENPDEWLDGLKAGAIFVGSDTPVAWGDYWAGPNHTLPTSGHARFRGPLSTSDFMVPYSVIRASSDTIATSGESVITLANKEGLAGHALSVKLRRDHD